MNRTGKIGLALALLLAGAARDAFALPSEEIRLSDAQSKIDSHSRIRSNEDHAKKLGEHFKVPASTILTLSAQNQGWGAVNVELALAWEANRLHPQAYPAITGALSEVERQRAGGSNWAAIAKALDVSLAPVVKEARETAKTLRALDHAAQHKKAEAAKVAESQALIKEDHQILKTNEEKKAQ